jgi:hypothetical protein
MRVGGVALIFLGALGWLGQAWLGATSADAAPAVAGLFTYYRPEKQRELFPESQTHLVYYDFDREQGAMLRQLEADLARIQGRQGYVLQVGMQTRTRSLPELIRALKHPHHPVSMQLERLLQILDRSGVEVYLRPLSEMNDGSAPWELNFLRGGRVVNTTESFVRAWDLLAKRVRAKRSPSLKLLFSPMVNRQRYSIGEVREILLQIPPSQIDLFAPTVYSRPDFYFGGDAKSYDRAALLLEPWLRMLQSTPHADLPLAVAELGFFNAGLWQEQTRALDQAVSDLRARGFSYLLYFQAGNAKRDWAIPAGVVSTGRLRAAIERFQER